MTEETKFTYMSEKIDHLRIASKALINFLKVHNIQGDFLNVVDFENDTHISNELRRQPVIVECREELLNYVTGQDSVECIIIHRTVYDKSSKRNTDNNITIDNRHAKLVIIIGDVTSVKVTVDRDTIVYCKRSENTVGLSCDGKPCSKAKMYGSFREMLRDKKHQLLTSAENEYSQLMPTGLVYSDIIGGSKYGDLHIGITDKSNLDFKDRTYTKDSISVLCLINESIKIAQPIGLYIVYGKFNKQTLQTNLDINLYGASEESFAVFFPDMYQEEVNNARNVEYFYGCDTVKTACPLLLEYITSSSILSMPSVLSKVGKEVDLITDVYIDCYLNYAFATKAKKANLLFDSMLIQTGFYIPAPMSFAEKRRYESKKNRLIQIAANSKVRAPYRNEEMLIDATTKARYDNINQPHDYALMISNFVEGTASDSVNRAMLKKYGRDAVKLFKVGDNGRFINDKILLGITSDTYIHDFSAVFVRFDDANVHHTLYVEDCIFVIVLTDSKPGTIGIIGNVHTLVNYHLNVKVEFDNFSPLKNTLSILTSERGSLNDHFMDYDDEPLLSIIDSMPDDVTSSIKYGVPTNLKTYRSMVKRYIYSNPNLRNSFKLANIDERILQNISTYTIESTLDRTMSNNNLELVEELYEEEEEYTSDEASNSSNEEITHSSEGEDDKDSTETVLSAEDELDEQYSDDE